MSKCANDTTRFNEKQKEINPLKCAEQTLLLTALHCSPDSVRPLIVSHLNPVSKWQRPIRSWTTAMPYEFGSDYRSIYRVIRLGMDTIKKL
jgi:hypothetical protein